MKSSAKKIELASVDDLFSTEESRADAQREKVVEIPLSELHPFKGHPFKVKDDEAMMETADSIKQYGVLVPAIARPDPEGGYELVAGHRRHRASELAEKETMPVIVRDLDDDAATIIMVDSNLQRESLLPSERAFAYKMKLDAMKHQGERVDLTSSQVGTKLRADEILAQQAGSSRNQVQRYSFWSEPGLKRSLDKIYEIVVYALFSTLVDALNLQVEISVDEANFDILAEFSDFAKMVMCLDFSNPSYIQDAKVYRVGVTNAADRGLDMYSNWGPAIQIKHLSLDVELAKNIVDSVSSDKVVIVCKDAERDVIVSLLTQIGWRNHIQSIVTESNLICWYEKALRGKYAEQIGDELIIRLCGEIAEEFPSVDTIPDIIKNRHYEKVETDDFWKAVE